VALTFERCLDPLHYRKCYLPLIDQRGTPEAICKHALEKTTLLGNLPPGLSLGAYQKRDGTLNSGNLRRRPVPRRPVPINNVLPEHNFSDSGKGPLMDRSTKLLEATCNGHSPPHLGPLCIPYVMLQNVLK
jgi:hypothetical protein